MTRIRIGLAQINSTVGDLAGNAQLILQNVAAAPHCDLVLFPEMSLPGYPPEDLLLKPSFLKDNLAELHRLARQIKKTAALVGFVDMVKGQPYNAAAFIEAGKVRSIYHKRALPNYGVFDEQRYFNPGAKAAVHSFRGFRLGLTICEDIWMGPAVLGPLKKLRPDVALNISASPFHQKKILVRHKIGRDAARFLRAPLLYCNLVGGQDELVFDGGSFATSTDGRVAMQGTQFQPGLFTVEVEKRGEAVALSSDAHSKILEPTEEVFHALVLGLRDYVEKNGFTKVALGISGGIDSALVAAVAAEALGPDRVIGVTMPSRYNSTETQQDAAQLAKNLGIKLLEIPIEKIFNSFLSALKPVFAGTEPNIAEENLQARIRGSLLMALSNKFGWLIVTTGNKSEISTGYCTLYGDTAGGFAVLKDLIKTTVYALSSYVNQRASREVIPQSIIDRPPTAELRDNQRDEDSLGAYADLDPIIVEYIEHNRSIADIARKNPAKRAYVSRILSLIDRSEYKRRQAPLGIKITPRSFGRDHRMPVTNKYRPRD